jgi:O-antigen ligase
MKKYIFNLGADWLAKLGFLGILGLTPIIFNYFYPTSIDLSKIVTFRIFILLLLFAIVWRFSKFKLDLDKKIYLKVLPLLVLLLFLSSSLFFSVDVATSWFGAYGRYEGLVSWLFYGLWFVLLLLHLNENNEVNQNDKIRQLIIISSVSGFLVSFYAILQLFGVDFITWSESAKVTGRAVSSFGQPNYLACWLLIVLPFSAFLFYTSKNKIIRIIWALIFVTELVALLSTGSRAVFVTFIIISVIWLFWFLYQKKALSRRKSLFIISLAIIVTLFFTIFLAVSNQARFSELTNFKKGSAHVRYELFKSGFQGFLKKPLLGYGLDNQKEVYVKYYQSDWAIYSNPNIYSDRAHNLVLDTLLTSGIVGLLIFVYFFYWVYANLFKSYKQNNDRELAAFLLWSLTVYLVSLLFNFSVTVTNIYFWLIVGLAFVLANKPVVTVKTDQKNQELARLVLVASAAVLFFYGVNLGFNSLKADYYYMNALVAIDKPEYFTATTLKGYMLETKPNIVDASFYNQSISLRLIERLPNIIDKSSIYVVSKDLAITENLLPASNFENNFVKAFTNGIMHRRGAADLMFQNLATISPNLPKIYLAWGDVLLFNQDYEAAKEKFEIAGSLLPDSNNEFINQEQKGRLEAYKKQVTSRLDQVNILK